MKCILIVEPDSTIRDNLAELLSDQSEFIRVLSSSGDRKALETIKMFQIDLVITTVRTKTQEGFKLLETLVREKPEIKILAIAPSTSSKMVARLEKLGIQNPLTAPADAQMLKERILAELKIDHGGQIRGIGLSSFLQMLELENKTCHLEISAGKHTGHLFLQNGELLDAETGGNKGKDAALTIMAWEDIRIAIDYSPPKRKRTIQGQLMGLLLESKKQQDEVGHRPADKRKHLRVGCLIAVDFDIDAWSYQSFIRNLSLGGAYIETDQPVTIGEKISLSMSLQNPKQSCRIFGNIVRRDARGVGVQFDPLTMRQRNILESIILPKKDKLGL